MESVLASYFTHDEDQWHNSGSHPVHFLWIHDKPVTVPVKLEHKV